MMLRKILLGTTAVVGAGMAVVASPSSARSAEVLPGGYPDIELTGFARFEAFGGEQDDRALDPNLSRGLDFRNDTEVHVIARGKSEESGLEYGATIEFEADTNNTSTPTRPGSSSAAAGARSGWATRTAWSTTAWSVARPWRPARAVSTARMR